MKLRHVLLAALSCIVLVGAQGSGQGGGTDTGMGGGTGGTHSGQQDGNRGGEMDSMMIMGTVESYDSTDSMLVIRTDAGPDTVYVNSTTKMNKKAKLVPGEKIIVKYQMKNDKKMATHLMAGKKTKSQKGEKKSDTSTTPGGGSSGGSSGGTQ